MISILNRVQLTSTYDELKRQEIAILLRRNTIPYKEKIKNLNAYSFRPTDSRAFIGSYGIHEKNRFEYIFYVNKTDYNRAKHILYISDGI